MMEKESTEITAKMAVPKHGEPIIEIRNLYKSFGDNHVLTDFNFTLYKGENAVVLGKSGCGKSVLIKCIIGLLTYDSGSIKVFGNEIATLKQSELDTLRARIGFVFQSSALYDSMTVRENLEFPMRRHKKNRTKEEINDLINETLNNVGLLNAIDLMPSELSGGMRKRIGLARALILKPELMLYDEPTTGLDPITSREITSLMLQMQNKYHTTSVIISHDMHCARLTANKLVVLIDGINYAEGRFDELERLEDPKVHAFFEHD
jgi:phospholipid/cholesterol/gamma-HCH transport system ATP-binding protein